MQTKENRISVVSILVSDRSVSEEVNAVLSEYGGYIVGRMGIPYREKSVSVLSVVGLSALGGYAFYAYHTFDREDPTRGLYRAEATPEPKNDVSQLNKE